MGSDTHIKKRIRAKIIGEQCLVLPKGSAGKLCMYCTRTN